LQYDCNDGDWCGHTGSRADIREGLPHPTVAPEPAALACGLSPRPACRLEAGWTFPADWPRTGLTEARQLPLFPVCRVWM